MGSSADVARDLAGADAVPQGGLRVSVHDEAEHMHRPASSGAQGLKHSNRTNELALPDRFVFKLAGLKMVPPALSPSTPPYIMETDHAAPLVLDVLAAPSNPAPVSLFSDHVSPPAVLLDALAAPSGQEQYRVFL